MCLPLCHILNLNIICLHTPNDIINKVGVSHNTVVNLFQNECRNFMQMNLEYLTVDMQVFLQHSTPMKIQ
jgi:hypothetical protein